MNIGLQSGISGGASFSNCGKYRYDLWRIGDIKKPRVAYLLLNPSTADESSNDPTVERCQRRAMELGFGSMRILNIFAYRATDPRDMKAQADPVGPDNDEFIRRGLRWADTVICAWGSHGAWRDRSDAVRKILRDCAVNEFRCLGVTAGGQPKHPLYISYKQQLQPFVP